MQRLLFVHVPKTAGTSFRTAAESYFKNRVVLDYGKAAPQTDELVREYVYTKEDRWAFYKALDKQAVSLVGGHFALKKYVAGIGLKNSVVFLREPIQRLYSEYQHFVRHNGYSRDFASFYKVAGRVNGQTKSLSKIPVEAVGFVGITEKYDSGIQIVNDNYGTRLKHTARNKGRRNIGEAYEVDSKDVREIERLHADDFELYRHACRLFDQREALFSRGLPYVHAVLTGMNKGRAIGWAWWAGDRDDPVEVQVRINGEVVGSAFAKSFRASLSQFFPPRGGYVGFELPVTVKPGDKLDCQVRETGQVFPLDPQVVE